MNTRRFGSRYRIKPQLERLELRQLLASDIVDPPVAQKAEFHYWVDGEDIGLNEHPYRVAIGMRAGANIALPSELTYVRPIAGNVAVYESTKLVDDVFRASLTQLDGVEFATNVFVNTVSDSEAVLLNEIIVSLDTTLDVADFFARHEEFSGYRRLDGTPDQYIATVKAGYGETALSVGNEIANAAGVNWMSPNFYQSWKKFFTPNDPLFTNQWHLNNTGQGGGTVDADSDLPEAWDIIQGGSSSIIVAVIDDGVQSTHPDLNVWTNPGEVAGDGIDNDGNGWIDDIHGWNFVFNTNQTEPIGSDEHGTSVSGVATARGNNGLGVAGSAFRSQVIAIKMFDGNSVASDANIAAALNYAAGRTRDGNGTWRAGDVVNNSWGGGGVSAAINSALSWGTVNGRQGAGATYLFATGNGFTSSVSQPAAQAANIPGVIAVGATNNKAQRSDYSNYGAPVDIVAPSNDTRAGYLAIETTDRTGAAGYASGDYTGTGATGFGGTSSATPLASGIAALVLARAEVVGVSISPAELRGLMRNATDFLPGYSQDIVTGKNIELGYGRINAFSAVDGVGKAEISVVTATSEVLTGGTVNLGSVNIGQTISVTLRVRNQGTSVLDLNSLNIPSPFSIVSGFEDPNLAVGESTTFTVGFTPTVPGPVTRNGTIDSNDIDEASFVIKFAATGIPVAIAGTVFEDFNGDGFRASSDLGVNSAGVAFAYLDTNNNGIWNTAEPRTFADATGYFAFVTLPNGTYNVRSSFTGWTQSGPAGGAYSVTITSPADFNIGKDFGYGKNGRLYGFAFNDLNSDGLIDSGEAGIANQLIYLDQNSNLIYESPIIATNNTPVPVFDLAVSTSTITITDPLTIIDVNVKLTLPHTWMSDLDLTLIGPDGTRVLLESAIGGSNDGFIDTVFDDEAATAIGAGFYPYTGTFRPVSPLSAFDGKSTLGDWTLEANDLVGGDEGTIVSWTLTFDSPDRGQITNAEGYVGLDLAPGTTQVPLLPFGAWDYTLPSDGVHFVNRVASPVRGINYGLLFGNFAPTALFLNGDRIFENSPAFTYVGQLLTADPNRRDTFTYSLEAGTGDNDNASFFIFGDSLFSTVPFDFETQSTLSIRVRTTDSGDLSIEEVFTINVDNVNEAPAGLSVAPATLPENELPGYAIGTLSANDPDAGDTILYQFANGLGGGDNALFQIQGNTLKSRVTFDFESRSTYSIRLRGTDLEGLKIEGIVTIYVTNVNESPVSIALVGSELFENSPIGTKVGNLQATDLDAGDLTSLTLVPGAGSSDNAKFKIVGGELQSNTSLDFETQTAYSIRVRATDLAGLWIERAFTVSVLNVNETPTGLTLSPSSINEGLAVNSTVGSFTTLDPDAAGSFKYELVTDPAFPDNQKFTIAGAQLRTAAVFNFETKNSYSVLVRTTDQGGLAYTQTMVVGVLNVNDPPSDIGLSNRSVAEDKPAGSLIGSFSTVDPDSSDTFTYKLVAGVGGLDNASFSVVGNQLFTNTTLNFELKSSYSIRVQSKDSGGITLEKVFAIDVTNVNEVPTGMTLSPATIAENNAVGAIIGALATQDPDAGDTFTYSFATGTGSQDNGQFSIVNSSLQANASFDFESKSSYSVRIKTTDAGGLSIEKPFTVSITNVNESPFNLILSGGLPENSPLNVVAITAAASDSDAGDVLTYSLVPGAGADDNAKFAINASGGLSPIQAVDFETQSSYSVRVKATDLGGKFIERVFAIAVVDLNEAPTQLSLTPSSLSENSVAGTSVGTLATVDQDALDSFTYSLVSGAGSTDNASFSVVGGEIRSLAPFDFETKNTYTIRVRTTDLGGLWTENAFTISVKDVNETPTAIGISSSSIAENSVPNSLVGSLSTVDVDAGDSFVYTLVEGAGSADNASFTIVNNQLNAISAFDFETKATYNVRIRTTDRGGLFTETPMVISVTNVNDLPSNPALSSSTIDENLAAGTLIGTLSSTDQDATDSVTFRFVSGTNDNAKFRITGNQLFSTEAFDFETKLLYQLQVQAIDNSLNGPSQLFLVLVNDANDPITDIKLSSSAVNENVPAGSAVGLLSAVDQDNIENHQFSLVSGVGSTDNSKFSIAGNELRLVSSPNFESQASYSILVRGIDKGGLSFDKNFVISVSDLPEAPTNLVLSNFRISENASSLLVGAVSATEQDAGDTLTYSFVTGEGSTNNNLFTLTDGNLVATGPFDYEVTPNLFVRIRATDSTQRSVEDFFVIVVDNVNETPTNILIPNKTLAENRPAGTLVSVLTTVDSDVGETYTYSLVPTATTGDNASFAIVGNELRTNRKLNFEAQNSFQLRIRSTDSTGLSVEIPVTITVTDVLELPILAGADAASTPTDAKIIIDVLANDRDPDGFIDISTVKIVSAPTAGTARVLPDGRIEFTPPVGQRLSATFSYTVQDNDEVVSNTAQVNVKIFSAFQNQRNPLDVDADGSVTPLDALTLVNDINANGLRDLPSGVPEKAPYLDTNGNGKLDPLDVLEVVNYINASKGTGAEGESRVSASKVDYAFASADLDSLVGTKKSRATDSTALLSVDDYYQNLDLKKSRKR